MKLDFESFIVIVISFFLGIFISCTNDDEVVMDESLNLQLRTISDDSSANTEQIDCLAEFNSGVNACYDANDPYHLDDCISGATSSYENCCNSGGSVCGIDVPKIDDHISSD